MPSAIFNVYTPKQQWERMWQGRTLEQEVRLCEFRELRKHLLDVLGQMGAILSSWKLAAALEPGLPTYPRMVLSVWWELITMRPPLRS